jgi:DNA-directed RNA polymerase subunit H
MDYEDLRILYESRKTLLKILAGRGYNTKAYEKFGPVEIHAMVSAGDGALRMDLERAPKEGIDYKGITKCTVVYVLGRVKNRLPSYVEALVNPDSEARVDPATTEVVVVSLGDQIVEAFHTAALQAYATRNLRIGFFQAAQLVNNPLEHVDVPPHEKMEEGEHESFLKEHRIKSKANLPPIKFHQDMIARILGLVPGDIVRIHRPSPTAGEGVYYRICKP